MKRSVIRGASFGALLLSIASLVASFAASGMFDNLHVSTDFIFLASALSLTAVAVSLGYFAKPISRVLRRSLGKWQIVFTQGAMDEDLYIRLSRELTAKGIRIWHDIEDLLPGDDFFKAVYNQLEESDALVLVSNPEEKAYHKDLVKFAIAHGVRIIPILKSNSDDIPEELESMMSLYMDEDPEELADAISLAVRRPKRT
jgi:hypothetical protein